MIINEKNLIIFNICSHFFSTCSWMAIFSSIFLSLALVILNGSVFHNLVVYVLKVKPGKLTEMNMDLEEGYDTKSSKIYDFLFLNSFSKKEDNFEVTLGFLEFFLLLIFAYTENSRMRVKNI